MSKTLYIWPEIQAICEKAGLDPNHVASVVMNWQVVQLSVYVTDEGGSKVHPLEQVIVTYPWTREP